MSAAGAYAIHAAGSLAVPPWNRRAEMHEEEGGERSPATLAGATVAPSVSNGVADPARYLPPHRGYRRATTTSRRGVGAGVLVIHHLDSIDLSLVLEVLSSFFFFAFFPSGASKPRRRCATDVC